MNLGKTQLKGPLDAFGLMDIIELRKGSWSFVHRAIMPHHVFLIQH